MITTRRIRVPYGETVDARDPTRVQEKTSNVLDALAQLIRWLGYGASVIYVSPNRIEMLAWAFGEAHFVVFEGKAGEMKPFLEAAFAFGFRETEKVNEHGYFFCAHKHVFNTLIGARKVEKIAEIASSPALKYLIYGSANREKFAYLIGSGLRDVGEIAFGMERVTIEDLCRVAELSQELGCSLGEILRSVCLARGGAMGKAQVRKRPSWQWFRKCLAFLLGQRRK